MPNTRLIALNHASNVTGTLLPIAEAGLLARRHGLVFLVDAAQTAGIFPIDVEALHIDLLAFPGHKGLYGPPGTGGLYRQGRNLPDATEVRRHRQPVRVRGAAGDHAGDVRERHREHRRYRRAGRRRGIFAPGGLDRIREHEIALLEQLRSGLAAIPGMIHRLARKAASGAGPVSEHPGQRLRRGGLPAGHPSIRLGPGRPALRRPRSPHPGHHQAGHSTFQLLLFQHRRRGPAGHRGDGGARRRVGLSLCEERSGGRSV